MKNPHKTVASATKSMYTVQVCCSAVGQFLAMYVVYKGKHLHNTWCMGGPENAKYNCSDSGWMEGQQFREWFEKVFVPETSSLDGAKLLIFDGHSSHLSPQVVETALENNIELLCLPAHTSSILQPLDVGVFKTVKGAWRKCLQTFYDQTRYCNIDKRAFPSLLNQLVTGGAFSRANAISAFEACGIYPLNRLKITSDKLSASVPLTHQSPNPDVAVNSVEAPVPLNDAGPSKSMNVAERPQTHMGQVPGSDSHTESTPKQTLTPRKALETAIVSHLRHITPTGTQEKRVRVRRTLAECTLKTVHECVENLSKFYVKLLHFTVLICTVYSKKHTHLFLCLLVFYRP